LLNIYEILVVMINNCDDVEKLLDSNFLNKAISNITSYDSEERVIVKLLIHKLYSSSFEFRKLIIKKMEDKLLDILYNSSKVIDIIGINDILEVSMVGLY
jgi:hypothetical protein